MENYLSIFYLHALITESRIMEILKKVQHFIDRESSFSMTFWTILFLTELLGHLFRI